MAGADQEQLSYINLSGYQELLPPTPKLYSSYAS